MMTSLSFKDLGLSKAMLAGLRKKGFEHPTDIQAQTIPALLSGQDDIIGQAQTGTGKTAAFGIPILETILPDQGHIQALVLTPTRELTLQVAKELTELAGEKGHIVTPIYGGQSYDKQLRQLRKSNDIVVGTPGRLIDHLKRKKLDLSKIDYLILDEADEMLTSGFIDDLNDILSACNPARRMLLFSATMPKPIAKLAETYMRTPLTIQAKRETLATSLTTQLYYEVRESDKLEALCRIMDVEDHFYGLIFCRTKRDVDTICERLIHRGYDAEAMHGDLSQHQRERVLKKFRAKLVTILVVTDVASRGLDISGLSHVINYALPQDAETYIHRVGRTGRAGQRGHAITFITPSEFRKFSAIQRVAKTDIQKRSLPEIDQVIAAKRHRIQSAIGDIVSKGAEPPFKSFAAELLADCNAEEALAAALQLTLAATLSETSYEKLRPVSARAQKAKRLHRRSTQRSETRNREGNVKDGKGRRPYHRKRKGGRAK